MQSTTVSHGTVLAELREKQARTRSSIFHVFLPLRFHSLDPKIAGATRMNTSLGCAMSDDLRHLEAEVDPAIWAIAGMTLSGLAQAVVGDRDPDLVRRIRYWTTAGVLAVVAADGRQQRRYAPSMAYTVRVVDALASGGASLGVLRNVAEMLPTLRSLGPKKKKLWEDAIDGTRPVFLWISIDRPAEAAPVDTTMTGLALLASEQVTDALLSEPGATVLNLTNLFRGVRVDDSAAWKRCREAA